MKTGDVLLGPPISRNGERFGSFDYMGSSQYVWRVCTSVADIELWLHWYLDVAEVDFNYKVTGYSVPEDNKDVTIPGGRGKQFAAPADFPLQRVRFDKYPLFNVLPTRPPQLSLDHPAFYAKEGVEADNIALGYIDNTIALNGFIGFDWQDGLLKIYSLKDSSVTTFEVTLTKERAKVVSTEVINPDLTVITTLEYTPTRLFSDS